MIRANKMHRILMFILLGLSGAAVADTFDKRVDAARNAEHYPAYKKYQTRMFDAIGAELASAVNHCVTQTENADTRPFALVADLSPGGRALNIAARPDTNVAQCLAKAYGLLKFPPPPKLPGNRTLPVVINLSIAP